MTGRLVAFQIQKAHHSCGFIAPSFVGGVTPQPLTHRPDSPKTTFECHGFSCCAPAGASKNALSPICFRFRISSSPRARASLFFLSSSLRLVFQFLSSWSPPSIQSVPLSYQCCHPTGLPSASSSSLGIASTKAASKNSHSYGARRSTGSSTADSKMCRQA
ncbi:hypothetical protein BJV74DRAFT_106200 [Russula compacta]|nr:hypothetical protein BJV74DRAFT_106200 [Russula compacta]